MSVYYNEIDPHAAAWLRELIRADLIAPGEVDERSITEVRTDDIRKFSQCHFFAGIGGWSLALRLAGWSDDLPVWTGSCPCQPYSTAGKNKGDADERNLWPHFFRLIRECRPLNVFGEQVENAIGHGWLDGISADLEGESYALGAVVLGAHSVRSPNIRQRLYWMAHAADMRSDEHGNESRREPCADHTAEREGIARGLADAQRPDARRGGEGGEGGERSGRDRLAIDGAVSGRLADPTRGGFGIDGCAPVRTRHADERGADERMGESIRSGLEGHAGDVNDGHEPGRDGAIANGSASEAGGNGGVAMGDTADDGRGIDEPGRGSEERAADRWVGPWDDFELVQCSDGKSRRIEPGSCPLVNGLPRGMVHSGNLGAPINAQATAEARVMRLKGYGNAINPWLAAEFIIAADAATLR